MVLFLALNHAAAFPARVERADGPVHMPATRHAQPDLTLREILEPFANHLEAPYIECACGAGEPSEVVPRTVGGSAPPEMKALTRTPPCQLECLPYSECQRIRR